MEEERKSRANLALGVILIAFGVFTLVSMMLGINVISRLWPLFVILPGLAFFAGMMIGGKHMGGLAIPGSIITVTGLILLYQSLFNHYESWAYMWTLIMPTATGIGMIIHGTWGELPNLAAKGWKLVRLGMILFVAMGFFFEVIIGLSGSPVMKIAWPVMLIALGGLLLLRIRKREKSPAEPPASTDLK